jgi:hypothetical protein
MNINLFSQSNKQTDNLGNLSVDWKVIFQQILEEKCLKVWTGLKCLRFDVMAGYSAYSNGCSG